MCGTVGPGCAVRWDLEVWYGVTWVCGTVGPGCVVRWDLDVWYG